MPPFFSSSQKRQNPSCCAAALMSHHIPIILSILIIIIIIIIIIILKHLVVRATTRCSVPPQPPLSSHPHFLSSTTGVTTRASCPLRPPRTQTKMRTMSECGPSAIADRCTFPFLLHSILCLKELYVRIWDPFSLLLRAAPCGQSLNCSLLQWCVQRSSGWDNNDHKQKFRIIHLCWWRG